MRIRFRTNPFAAIVVGGTSVVAVAEPFGREGRLPFGSSAVYITEYVSNVGIVTVCAVLLNAYKSNATSDPAFTRASTGTSSRVTSAAFATQTLSRISAVKTIIFTF